MGLFDQLLVGGKHCFSSSTSVDLKVSVRHMYEHMCFSVMTCFMMPAPDSVKP